jgi:A/G-specific adenine glycosylase
MEHLSQQLLSWYGQHQRRLTWRKEKSSYRVWISEIILQQTRVAQGMPYYLRFLEAFPDVMALAASNEEEVLRLWQGLGYYRRARNLHACARQVAHTLDGRFPRSAKELQQLPGIGPYTSAAIASIAFGEPVAAVDGNVYRILTRLYGIGEDIASATGKKSVAARAQELLGNHNPGDFNQAMMDLGGVGMYA